MLDIVGKVPEKLIRSRRAVVTGAAGDFFPRQFGFRAGRSTVDVVMQVVDAVHRAEEHGRGAWRVVLPTTLDARNAFNSVKWIDILGILDSTFHVPGNLLRYKRSEQDEVISRVAQRSILGPDLWNASYDSLIRLDMSEESRLVGYAHYVAVIVSGRTVEEVQSKLGTLMRRVSWQITANGLILELKKSRQNHSG